MSTREGFVALRGGIFGDETQSSKFRQDWLGRLERYDEKSVSDKGRAKTPSHTYLLTRRGERRRGSKKSVKPDDSTLCSVNRCVPRGKHPKTQAYSGRGGKESQGAKGGEMGKKRAD